VSQGFSAAVRVAAVYLAAGFAAAGAALIRRAAATSIRGVFARKTAVVASRSERP
jgi:hypothetical protein